MNNEIKDIHVRERLEEEECSERPRFRGKPAHREALFACMNDGGAAQWQRWRRKNERPYLAGLYAPGGNLARFDLSDAILTGADLRRADLRAANLSSACLRHARLDYATLAAADCCHADFSGAILFHGDLTAARCHEAKFIWATMSFADLTRAEMHKARMRRVKLDSANFLDADLIQTDLREADLNYACFCWTSLGGARLAGAEAHWILVSNVAVDSRTDQSGLYAKTKLTPASRRSRWPILVRANDIRVASFMGQMSRQSIDHFKAAAKESVVLILGSFGKARRKVLKAIEEELRSRRLTPIVFDFASESGDELVDTVRMMAWMSRFLIADLTKPSSVPFELASIVPDAMVPVVPIIQKGFRPFSMFEDLYRKYPWVLQPVTYTDRQHLMKNFQKAIVLRAERQRLSILRRRRKRAAPVGAGSFSRR